MTWVELYEETNGKAFVNSGYDVRYGRYTGRFTEVEAPEGFLRKGEFLMFKDRLSELIYVIEKDTNRIAIHIAQEMLDDTAYIAHYLNGRLTNPV